MNLVFSSNPQQKPGFAIYTGLPASRDANPSKSQTVSQSQEEKMGSNQSNQNYSTEVKHIINEEPHKSEVSK